MSSGLLLNGAPAVLLASASSTRAGMLSAAGVNVTIQPAAVDEAEIKASFKAAGASPGDVAIALAELKAERVAQALPEDRIVLGADQMLSCEQTWFDKPRDLDKAREQLTSLGGKAHQLHTAVVAFRGRSRIWHHLDLTTLWMRPLSPAFLDCYLDAVGDAVMETVGGYHIERLGAHLFSRIEGDHFSILGLPLLPTLAFLRDQGAIET